MGGERARADRAEKRADGAEATVGALRPRLTELRISERVAIDRAKYATGEADDLRKRLDSAEQLAGEERGRADRERDRAERVQARADRAEKRADDERDRANQAEARARDALLRVQELSQAMAEKAVTPEPDPPRTRWQRFKAWRRWPA